MKKSISLLLLSLLMIAPSCQKTKEAANEYNIVPAELWLDEIEAY